MASLNFRDVFKRLNKTYLNYKVNKDEIISFDKNIKLVFNKIKLAQEKEESEEHLKGYVKDLLNALYKRKDLEINTKDRCDLAIYKNNKVEVIIEAKSLQNKTEMIFEDNLNKKALHESIKYFFDEKLNGNNTVKNIIITDSLNWFIFDSNEFENKYLEKLCKDYRDGKTSFKNNDGLYKALQDKIKDKEIDFDFVYFNLSSIARTDVSTESGLKKFVNIYKLISPEFLLREYNPKDSNELNRKFYNELLYILGLEEKKESGKILIIPNGNKNALINEIIYKLEEEKGVHGKEEKNSRAFELLITWLNRILFLKLFEGQLVSFNSNNEHYKFFTSDKVKNFDDLNHLFFEILGKPFEERSLKYKDYSKNIPYLNSSLFERADIEFKNFTVSTISEDLILDIYKSSSLKKSKDYKGIKKQNLLKYLLDFLDSYDFTSYNSDELTKENPNDIINSSVLGLIFEKLNGYKDGSFYTPGFITEYMAKQALKLCLINKFKEIYKTSFEDLSEIKNFINKDVHQKGKLEEYNLIVDSIKVCDPAVGSGHFPVSVLNQIIYIKSYLNILCDEQYNALPCYVEIENDSLIIYKKEDSSLFVYKRDNKSSYKIQKAIFKEKQKIIENCLFATDINHKSVYICQLRLWVELLKNAYYKEDGRMELLPNIDINIKCGDSLISKYPIKINSSILDVADKRMKIKDDIKAYKQAVIDYKHSQSKEQKREVNAAIDKIKSKIFSTIQLDLFIDKSSENTFSNSMEWMIEFPELLDNDGNFIGFDIVIGNPPYIQLQKDGGHLGSLYEPFKFKTFAKTGDIYALFYEQANQLLHNGGILSFITSNKWMRAGYGKSLRNYISEKTQPLQLLDLGSDIFDTATVDTNILTFGKNKPNKNMQVCDLSKISEKTTDLNNIINKNSFDMEIPKTDNLWTLMDKKTSSLKEKIEKIGTPLKDWDIEIRRGFLTGYNEAFIINTQTRNEILSGCQSEEELEKTKEIIKPVLRGRDINKYSYEWKDLWGIGTFPVRSINIEEYPSLKFFLQGFGKKLAQTGEVYIDSYGKKQRSRKKTKNKWFETQDPNAYYKEFEKEKIIFPRIVKSPMFMYDTKGYYGEATSNIITGEKLKYLIAFLNSSVVYKIFNMFYEGGGIQGEIKLNRLEMIPIPKIIEKNKELYTDLELLVDEILKAKEESSNVDTSDLEEKIDAMVYKLYDLTQEEINIIEGKNE
ncbi:MAG: Eco57I restriction-modification methylase domain-containing protein [Alphaproteobacteria bacterium]|jgi:hypothetical protein|nr:Eco57I restriction-modification methylase domain-containing protein [Alphaproteobacteria bacterium]